VPVDRERRLVIMKDPRLGGFGAVGLGLLLLVKFAALQGVMAGPYALLALVAVAAVARWAAVVAAYSYSSARPGGMGDHFRRGLTWRGLTVATVIALAAVAPLLIAGTVVWAAAAVACVLLALLAKARLGGLTGDVYGAIVELAETLALVVLCFL
jgi:adenosylcobinamide-GDP ribazoletransferase